MGFTFSSNCLDCAACEIGRNIESTAADLDTVSKTTGARKVTSSHIDVVAHPRLPGDDGHWHSRLYESRQFAAAQALIDALGMCVGFEK